MPTCATAEAEAPSPEAVAWPEAEALLCFSFRGSVVAWGWDGGGRKGCQAAVRLGAAGMTARDGGDGRRPPRRAAGPLLPAPPAGSRHAMTAESLRKAAWRGDKAGGGGGDRQAAGLAAGARPRLLVAGSGPIRAEWGPSVPQAPHQHWRRPAARSGGARSSAP